MPKPETLIENEVCDYAVEKGMLVRKFTSPGHRGVPDRIFLPDHAPIFFVEFKAPNEPPRGDQIREHKRYRRLGHSVFVIDNVEKGKEVVDFITSMAVPPVSD